MKKLNHKKIFSETLDHYFELHSIEGMQSVSSIYSNTSSICEFPIICNFIADFEILTERSLSKEDYKLFYWYYIEENKDIIKKYKKFYGPKHFWKKIDNIEKKLGKIYKQNNLYPLINYILPTKHAL